MKISTLSYDDLLHFNDYKKNSIISNFNLFFKQVLNNGASSQYDIYMGSRMFHYDFFISNSLSYNDYLEKNYRDFDLELFVTSLHKYYKHFNNDINIINWFSDFFIILFDAQKVIYDYQSNVESLNDIKIKDSFNLYKNFMGSISNVYKNSLNFFSYDDYKRTGNHYEDIFLSENIKKDVWDSLIFKSFYYRFFNYNRGLEQFLNSYLWISFDDSNFDLENYNLLFKYNKYLVGKSAAKLNKFKELNIDIKKVNTNININRGFVSRRIVSNFGKSAIEILMNARKTEKVSNKPLLQISDLRWIKKFLGSDRFLKKKFLNNNLLLNYFIKKNHKYDFFFNYKIINVEYFFKYIFFEKYIDNSGNKVKNFYIFDIKNYKYKYLNFKISEKYKK